jgi:hypothetical protein
MPSILAILAVIASLTSCSYFKRDNKPVPQDTSAALAAKKAFYCAEGKKILNQRGFMNSRCDSLLYTSLWSVSCEPVDLSDWEDVELPGKWHRNRERDCYLAETGPNGSNTSISRDMLLGRFHDLWSTKDRQNTRELIEYGEKNNWIMGDAVSEEELIGRCLLSPQLVLTLKEMDRQLGEQSGNPLRSENQDNSDDALPVNTGFRAHLDVVRVLLNGRVYGGISDYEKSVLKAQADRQPNNALFVAAYEKYNGGTKAHSLLLDETRFPGDRLPNSSDHCENYLFARDEDSNDWLPCPAEGLTHDGTDFVFAAWVALDGK